MSELPDCHGCDKQPCRCVRVFVRSSDDTESLGLGWYIGDVVVQVGMDEDVMVSYQDAEDLTLELPDGIPTTVDKTPKIILDSGETVYGCQTWWEPVDKADWPRAEELMDA